MGFKIGDTRTGVPEKTLAMYRPIITAKMVSRDNSIKTSRVISLCMGKEAG